MKLKSCVAVYSLCYFGYGYTLCINQEMLFFVQHQQKHFLINWSKVITDGNFKILHDLQLCLNESLTGSCKNHML